MHPSGQEFTPKVTDHDRLAVSVADTLGELTDSQRVRALAALPPASLIHLAISTDRVAPPPPALVCDYCAGAHVHALCPSRPGRRGLRSAFA
jgi:hypothetical protein